MLSGLDLGVAQRFARVRTRVRALELIPGDPDVEQYRLFEAISFPWPQRIGGALARRAWSTTSTGYYTDGADAAAHPPHSERGAVAADCHVPTQISTNPTP